jgi:hypothetical protein
MKLVNLISLIPSTLLTVLITLTAALRFYEPTDFPPSFSPTSLREWSLWAFLASLLVAVVDLCIEWNARNRETARQRDREDEERDRILETRHRILETRQREAEERNRILEARQREAEATERQNAAIKLTNQRDFALFSYLADPSEANRQQLEAICQEIELDFLSDDLI